MKDKDKKAFEKWHYDNIVNKPTLNDLITLAWNDACDYKQKENDELLKQLKHEHDLYKKHLKIYEDENTKLIDCVEHYAKIMEDDYGLKGNSAASQLLKELEGK